MTKSERKPPAAPAEPSRSEPARPESARLHPRNRHAGKYDFDVLTAVCPTLTRFVRPNPYGERSIDFADPKAVKAFNRALLQCHYGIADWDIPPGYLCPPIPGRADYLHGLADLLMQSNAGRLPRGEDVHVLDIGTGANLVYPLVGHAEYQWQFAAVDIDPLALDNARCILTANPHAAAAIELRLQTEANAIFHGVVESEERFDLTLCNPPFHASLEAAQAGTRRKWNNLGKSTRNSASPRLNFGGQGAELVCPGGEAAFIARMAEESRTFAQQCFWFTTLVSRADHLPGVLRALRQCGARQVRTIEMAQGQKQSRFVAWTFLSKAQQQDWRAARWTDLAV